MTQTSVLDIDVRLGPGEEATTSKAFYTSGPGRLAAAIGGFNLAGMGALALLGPQSYELWIIATIPMVSIVGGMLAIAFATMRDDFEPVLWMLLGFPFLGGLSLAGLYSASRAGESVGVVLLLCGLFVMALAGRLFTRTSHG
jgi:hypothetical protein